MRPCSSPSSGESGRGAISRGNGRMLSSLISPADSELLSDRRFRPPACQGPVLAHLSIQSDASC